MIGRFDIDILPNGDGVKVYAWWGGFRPQDFKRFEDHDMLGTLKKIYCVLKPDEFAKKPRFGELFDDTSVATPTHETTSKKKYLRGTEFVAYLRLRIILKPNDPEKGKMCIEYTNYGFPGNVPESFRQNKLCLLLQELISPS